jgi:class 3 adenylate cyclase
LVADFPETHYARSADGTNLAYQVIGDGPLDLVFLHVAYPIDLLAEDPGFVRLRRRLATFSRSVWFDARGNGASEGDFRDTQRREIFDADLIAVIDAAGLTRPAMVAEGFPGLGAVRFTTSQPQRVGSLVLINSYAYYLRGEDYPWGIRPKDIEATIALTRKSWGTAAAVPLIAPSRAGDERFRAWYGRAARFTGGPDLVADMIRAGLEADVRPLLSSISVPTLVLHREGNLYIDLGAGRYLAEHIPGARFVVLPGDEHLFFVGDTDALVEEIEEFLTGTRSKAEGDIVMAAVLFTDIVASTEHQARVGSREWSRLSDRHDAMVRAALLRHGGHEVKTTGDGFLVTFNATGSALRCAADILADANDIGLNLRAGLHTGELELRDDDIAGLAVNIASRVCAWAGPGEVLVTETVRLSMVGSAMAFEDRGKHELKGVPGLWRLFVLRS